MADQPIVEIGLGDLGQGPDGYRVGHGACTRIEAIEKPGEYASIPWVRVWAGEAVLFECSQHKIFIWYGPPIEGESNEREG